MRELASFLGGVAASCALAWLIRRHAVARGLMDIPNVRSSHLQPTPRGGGLAIVMTVLAAALIAGMLHLLPAVDLAALAIGGGMVAAVGYVDDLKGLSVLPRFAVHLIAAVVTVVLLVGVRAEVPVFSEVSRPIALSALVLGVLWSTNLFNFMDGIDGIAGSQAAFVSIASVVLIAVSGGASSPWVVLPLATAGACFGFLVWNWPPARIFMGDVGSGFLGFWLAAVALAFEQVGILSIWTSTILGSVFIADATVTLLRRILRREQWHEAHRSHAYQALARRWNSHRRVTLLLWTLNILIAFPLAATSAMVPGIAPQIALASLGGFGLLAVLAGAGRGEKRD